MWFNSPVDVEGLRLHDYHAIIRRPMDLGTVKRNLAAGRYYPSHEAFAADVRLTFNNAARYNPPDHHVHRYAGSLLATFEGLYGEAVSWFDHQRRPVEPPPPLPQQPVSVPVQAPPPGGCRWEEAQAQGEGAQQEGDGRGGEAEAEGGDREPAGGEDGERAADRAEEEQ